MTAQDGNDAWSAMWRVWDWGSWLKPQIDDAAKVGNVVRLFGNTLCIGQGNVTIPVYLSRWRQFLDYCAGLDLLVYPVGGDLGHWGVSDAQAADIYGEWAGVLKGYRNVIGVDVSNEAIGSIGGDASRLALVSNLGSIVRAGSGLPVTHSMPLTDPNWWTWDGGTTFPIRALMDESDFLDYHIYVDATPAQVAQVFGTEWGAGKQMIVGEFGVNETSTERTARYQQIANIVRSRPDIVGALAWSCYDISTTPDWQFGLYDSSRRLRTDISVPFADIPMIKGASVADNFSVTAAWDKASYNSGDVITGTISGNDVLTQTTTTQQVVGPVVIPLVAADGAQSTVTLPAVQVAVTAIASTPESVVIDTSRPIVDSGPNPRNWVASANKLSISATA